MNQIELESNLAQLVRGSKIDIWILGRKASAIFEEYTEDSEEIVFTHNGRKVCLCADLIDKIEFIKI